MFRHQDNVLSRPSFIQNGRDCFLLACEAGHQEIVCELLTKDKVDQNVVDKVRNLLSSLCELFDCTCAHTSLTTWHFQILMLLQFSSVPSTQLTDLHNTVYICIPHTTCENCVLSLLSSYLALAVWIVLQFVYMTWPTHAWVCVCVFACVYPHYVHTYVCM